MASLGFVDVVAMEPQTDNTYLVRIKIWADVNSVELLNDTAFGINTLSSTVNAALKAFARAYAEEHWNLEFGPLDDMKLLRPVSLI